MKKVRATLFEQLDKLRKGETTVQEAREVLRTAGHILKNAKQL